MVTNCEEPPALVLDNLTAPRLEWKKWEEQWTRYAAAAQLHTQSPRIQVDTFKMVIGPQAWQISSHFHLTESEQLDLDLILRKFRSYFEQQKNVVLERFHFNRLHQGYYLTFEEFLDKLHKAAVTCNFGDMTEELIRDRIVAGIQCRGTQTRLFNEQGLTLQRAIEICRSREHLARPTRPMPSYRRALRYSQFVRQAQQKFDRYRRSGQPYHDNTKVKIIEPIIEIKDPKEEMGTLSCVVKKEIISESEAEKNESLSNAGLTVNIKKELNSPEFRANVKLEPADGDGEDIEMSIRADIDNMNKEMGFQWGIPE